MRSERTIAPQKPRGFGFDQRKVRGGLDRFKRRRLIGNLSSKGRSELGCVYLCSDLSSGVTGENVYVDAGYNIVGL